jgi:hypothetical protein
MDSAKAAVDAAQKESKAGADSMRPGSIDLVVANVLETDRGYDVFIDDESRKSAVTSQTCTIMKVAPGLHELALTATLSGAPAHHSESVTVTAGAAAKVSVTLAKTKAVAQV